jgi:hydroxypyruvate isomerase
MASKKEVPLRSKYAVNVEMWWTGQDFMDRIKSAAKAGFPAIEFWGTDGKDLKKIRALCDELKLDIAQFTAWGFEPGMNDPANHVLLEEKIREACENARTLRCSLATVVGGNDQPGMTQETMHQNIINGLKRVAPIVEDSGLTLILEPMNIRVDHKGHCLYGSTPAVRICKEVGSPNVRINWDLYHMHITEGDLCGHLREGIGQIGYIQVADHPGRHEPGTGEINYGRVLKEIRDLGYTGYIGLECNPTEPARAWERIQEADRWEAAM